MGPVLHRKDYKFLSEAQESMRKVEDNGAREWEREEHLSDLKLNYTRALRDLREDQKELELLQWSSKGELAAAPKHVLHIVHETAKAPAQVAEGETASNIRKSHAETLLAEKKKTIEKAGSGKAETPTIGGDDAKRLNRRLCQGRVARPKTRHQEGCAILNGKIVRLLGTVCLALPLIVTVTKDETSTGAKSVAEHGFLGNRLGSGVNRFGHLGILGPRRRKTPDEALQDRAGVSSTDRHRLA